MQAFANSLQHIFADLGRLGLLIQTAELRAQEGNRPVPDASLLGLTVC